MAELGKIEKPEASSFKAGRKLYVVPTLPFEDLALQFKLENAKIERFWGEVREKIEYFISTYGNISVVYLEELKEAADIGIFEKYGKDSNHYRLMKSLVDGGAKLQGIDKEEYMKKSKLLFEEYSRSFLPEIKEIFQGYYGKDIDFDGWREYLVKKIQETQEEMSRSVSNLIKDMPEGSNGILVITDGRPVEFPEGMDVFQIRPPAFDEIERTLRLGMK